MTFNYCKSHYPHLDNKLGQDPKPGLSNKLKAKGSYAVHHSISNDPQENI